MNSRKTIAILCAAVLAISVPIAVHAEEYTYPSDSDDYKAMVSEYPDYYRIQGDSVYFLEHSLMGETDFVISSDALSTVEYVDFGYVFTPEEDGRYVIVLEETIQDGAVEGDIICEFEYKNKHAYIADVENGEITVSYEGSSDGKTDYDDTPCADDRDYYSYVNGELPGHYDRYITTVYSYHSVSSYFCLNSGYTDGLLGTDVTTSDNTVAYCGIQMGVSSSLTTDDVQALSIVRAVSDGEAVITLNDEMLFYVSVENGIFRRAEEMTVQPTEPEASYEPLGVLSFGSLPDKTAYAIGESLDLTGLTVSLDYYYGMNGHECIYDNVSPLEHPDAFIVDTSDFDSTTAGTYEIRVSCTTETGMTYWAIETISFDVIVGEQPLLSGDVNNDGKFSLLDIIMLQKYLLSAGNLTAPQNADLCEDETIDAFDLAVMKRMLIEQNTAGTPDNMPVIMDYHDEVTDAERETFWTMLSDQYPDMYFSDFTFVHDPDHPLSDYYNGKLFSIYYKNILLHGYGNINCDANVFAVVGDTNAVNFVVDPKLFKQVDLEQEILPPLEVIPTCIDVEQPELILYVDTIEENPPRLAYRAVEISGDAEYILDAVTGEIIEYIPYYVV